MFTDLNILGLWEKDGSFTPLSEVDIHNYFDSYLNHYTLSQITNTSSLVFSYVHSFNQKMNISAGLGPHINWMIIKQSYDNVPILINQGVAFKRYEVEMNFIGLGATAALDFEYFILPGLL